jgi:arylsulfatase A-like enzyme
MTILDRWPRWLSHPLAGIALVAFVSAAAAYLASWCLYLRIGRFANVETIEFLLANWRAAPMLTVFWHDEWASTAVVAVLATCLAVALPCAFRALVATPSSSGDSSRLGICQAATWCFLISAPQFLESLTPPTTSVLVYGAWKDAWSERTAPLITLFRSWVQSRAYDPIEPLLDVAELEPLTARPPMERAGTGERPPSIVFLAIESLRHDVVHQRHQGREITPHLNALAKAGVQFTKAYSQSTHSDYADVCIVSSLYPLRKRRHHYYRADDPWPKTTIYDRLHQAGYSTAIISSQNERWGGMDAFLDGPSLDLFYDAERSPAAKVADTRDEGLANEVRAGALRGGKLSDAHTTDVAIDWIGRQCELDKPFFLNMNFQNSHFPYEPTAGAEQAFAPCTIDFPASFGSFPRDKVDVVRNAYYNALQECDRQLGRLVEALRKAKRLDNTILVVLGENGEAFHENGIVCHAANPAEPALRVACVFHAPQLLAPRTDDYPVELIDVTPTALALAGWPSHPNFQGINVLSSSRPPESERLLFFHVNTPIASADAVLLAGRWKFIHDHKTNTESLFDVTTDPAESRNLVRELAQRPLAEQLRLVVSHWRSRQLAYYHFPTYYLRHYPPRPPRARLVPSPDAVSIIALPPAMVIAGAAAVPSP